MEPILIKSFLDHKSGVSYWDGADRSAMNLTLGRFAVADGVSQSYLPNLWANILCNSFVKSEIAPNDDWIGQYAVSQLASDCQIWEEQSEEVFENATEEEAFLLSLSQEEYRYAGTTLVGIALKDHSLFYNVLGDSCLFVYDSDTNSLVSYSTVDEQHGFTNRPDFFYSEGKIVGRWKHGKLPLKPGYLLLMTDALSDWLTKEFNKDSSLIEKLWALKTHKDFMQIVEEARSENSMKDDDVALLILKVSSDVADSFELLYADTIESLMATQSEDIELAEDGGREETTQTDEEKELLDVCVENEETVSFAIRNTINEEIQLEESNKSNELEHTIDANSSEERVLQNGTETPIVNTPLDDIVIREIECNGVPSEDTVYVQEKAIAETPIISTNDDSLDNLQQMSCEECNEVDLSNENTTETKLTSSIISFLKKMFNFSNRPS